MRTDSQSFKISIIASVGLFVGIFLFFMAVTPLMPRYISVFGRSMKVQHGLFDINKDTAMMTDRDWSSYKSDREMREWIRVNVDLERIDGTTAKNPEQTLSDGIGDRNDMAVLLVNMIYVISGMKVDLVTIKEDNPKSDYPMFYLYYQDVFYEVLNNRSYRGRKIIKHIPFEEIYSGDIIETVH